MAETNNNNNNKTTTTPTTTTTSKKSFITMSPVTSNQRLKYWVSSVAAVIDPTLPSPIPPPTNISTTTTPSSNTNTVVSSTDTTSGNDNNDNINSKNGTYIPPQIPPFNNISSSVSTLNNETSSTVVTTKEEETSNTGSTSIIIPKAINSNSNNSMNELDHQQYKPTITSKDEIMIFDTSTTTPIETTNDGLTPKEQKQQQSIIDNDDDNNNNNQSTSALEKPVTTTNTSTSSSSILLSSFPRLQTWRKSVTDTLKTTTITTTTLNSNNNTTTANTITTTPSTTSTAAAAVHEASTTTTNSTSTATPTTTTATAAATTATAKAMMMMNTSWNTFTSSSTAATSVSTATKMNPPTQTPSTSSNTTLITPTIDTDSNIDDREEKKDDHNNNTSNHHVDVPTSSSRNDNNDTITLSNKIHCTNVAVNDSIDTKQISNDNNNNDANVVVDESGSVPEVSKQISQSDDHDNDKDNEKSTTINSTTNTTNNDTKKTPPPTTSSSSSLRTSIQQWSNNIVASATTSTSSKSMIDTVALQTQFFRGRYSMNQNNNTTTTTPSSKAHTTNPQNTIEEENQAVRIRKLSSTNTIAANHYQQLTSSLQPYEYILLLGRGMLGVNLKQCYKVNNSVYVDYLIPNGNADKSHLVYIGDCIVSIGTTNCLTKQHHGTIATIPSIISNASRPVHITFTTNGCCSNNDNIPNPSMNYIDIAIALLHCGYMTTTTNTSDTTPVTNTITDTDTDSTVPTSNINNNAKLDNDDDNTVDDDTATSIDRTMTRTNANCLSPVTNGTESGPGTYSSCTGSEITIETTSTTNDDNDGMSLVQPTSFDIVPTNDDVSKPINQLILPDNCSIPDVITTKFDIDALIYPIIPSYSICVELMSHAAKRNIDPKLLTLDYTMALYHCIPNVKCAIQNAFIVCCADRRRLAFIKRYIQRQQEEEQNKQLDINDSIKSNQKSIVSSSSSSIASTKNYMIMLSLFIEMYEYVELYDIIPVSKQRDIVQRIAYKYFLPTIDGTNFQSPQYDYHTIVSDTAIRKFETTLKQQEKNTRYPRSIFLPFQQSLFNTLMESIFIPFLISHDCARMRAYLRNTAPYINVPISKVIHTLIIATDTTISSSNNVLPIQVYANNYFIYCIVYLLCMTENEEFGENDDILYDLIEPKRSIVRIENAANAICAAIFIQRKLIPTITKVGEQWKNEHQREQDSSSNNEIALSDSYLTLIEQLEQLWEMYIAPDVGSLVEGPNPTTAVQSLQEVRSTLLTVQGQAKHCTSHGDIITLLIDSSFVDQLNTLTEELIYDYAVRLHPKFRLHKFHEWICEEMTTERLKHRNENIDNNIMEPPASFFNDIPAISSGCVKRLLRKTKFPEGVTPHQPSHDSIVEADLGSSNETFALHPQHCNADCAIVFGTKSNSGDDSAMDESPIEDVCRYTCQTLYDNDLTSQQCLTSEDIPITLESYAHVPLSRSKPFHSTQDIFHTSDGWEISLVNFMLPRADAATQSDENSSIYGVSLMFQYIGELPKRNVYPERVPIELSIEPHNALESDASPVSSFDEDENEVDTTDEELNWFNRIKKEQHQNLNETGNDEAKSNFDPAIAIGIALVCQQNHILAMRETLSLLLQDYMKSSIDSKETTTLNLVNRLGVFTDPNNKSGSLREFLDPYIQQGSSSWIERPLGKQSDEFLQLSGQQMIQCLPPIPLALMFITALLEQKIVITSNRRSILLSVTVALQELLRPLQWCHLILARVPSSLASDLLQYPAPFILGLPSSDPNVTELLRELPSDITLVDLDIGRVILAPSFGHDSEFGRRVPATTTTTTTDSNISDNIAEKNIRILRSQVLYLAQCLGTIIGTNLYPSTWCSDHPLIPTNTITTTTNSIPLLMSQFDIVRNVCHQFVEELLAGTTSCCYWLEEAFVETSSDSNSNNNTNAVTTVLFDEDQFFRIKDARYRFGYTPLFPSNWISTTSNTTTNIDSSGTVLQQDHHQQQQSSSSLALSMNEFDYIIELLLRCQSMNAYIGTRQRKTITFTSSSSL